MKKSGRRQKNIIILTNINPFENSRYRRLAKNLHKKSVLFCIILFINYTGKF